MYLLGRNQALIVKRVQNNFLFRFEPLILLGLHSIKYTRMQFIADRDFSFKDKIYDSVLIQENTGQRQTMF